MVTNPAGQSSTQSSSRHEFTSTTEALDDSEMLARTEISRQHIAYDYYRAADHF